MASTGDQFKSGEECLNSDYLKRIRGKQSLWLTDIVHHYFAIVFVFLVAGHVTGCGGIKQCRKSIEPLHLRQGDHIVSSTKGSPYDRHGIYAGDNRVIHFLDQSIEEWEKFEHDLRRGDHIATSRMGGVYDHHGIYQGEDNCIHFRAPSKVSSQTEGYVRPLSEIPKCNCVQPTEGGGVVTTCLDCFHKGDTLCIIRYIKEITSKIKHDWKWQKSNIKHGKVIRGYRNNKFYLELLKDGGELLGHIQISKKESRKYIIDHYVRMSRLSSSKSPDEVIKTAMAIKTFGKYNLVLNNCEHFTVFCMTGKARSLQVEQKAEAIPWLGKAVYKGVERINQIDNEALHAY